MEKNEPIRSYKARNPEETRVRILSAAIDEFAELGFLGARVERIASRSGVTLRMIYHYFQSKASLYATVLQHVYSEASAAEGAFEPGAGSAEDGMRQVVDFAFDHFAARPDLMRLELGENLLRGEYLSHAGIKSLGGLHLFDKMKELLHSGQEQGTFRRDIDAVQLWIMIHSLCRSYLSQRHTLSWQLDADLSDSAFGAKWRETVERAVLATLSA